MNLPRKPPSKPVHACCVPAHSSRSAAVAARVAQGIAIGTVARSAGSPCWGDAGPQAAPVPGARIA